MNTQNDLCAAETFSYCQSKKIYVFCPPKSDYLMICSCCVTVAQTKSGRLLSPAASGQEEQGRIQGAALTPRSAAEC